MRKKNRHFSNIIKKNTNSNKNNKIRPNSFNKSNNEENSGLFKNKNNNINENNKQLNQINKKYTNFLDDVNSNGDLTPIKIKNNIFNFKSINKKEKDIKQKNMINSDEIPNTNSFIQSDIDEIKSIFNQNDLKNNLINDKYLDTTHLFENSEDMKKEEITINDLDPKIKDVTILFVLSSNYYELLVQERAKKAFNFAKKKIK